MESVEALLKSLNRERMIVWLVAACGCFGAAFAGVAVELKFVSPAMRQFIPLIYTLALIAASHAFLAMRLMSVVKTLAEFAKSQSRE